MSRAAKVLAHCPARAALLLTAWAGASQAQTFVDIPEPPQPDPQDIVPGFNVFFGDQFTVDDNLFRLPNGYLAASAGPGPVSLADHVDEAYAGLTDRLVDDLQNFAIDLRVNHDDYSRNSFLDNNSGNGSLVWNWGVASAWSGRLSADYSRGLVNFATTREFEKDLIDTASLAASGRYQIGPRWALTAQLQNADTSHTLDLAAVQDSHVDSGALGLEFAAGPADSVELQYRYTKAEFPNSVTTADSIQGNFRESSGLLLLSYSPTDQLAILANGGYLDQTYSSPLLNPYSGAIGHASVKWTPGEKTQLLLGASRDLTAYIAAASEYFVDDGLSAAANWQPLRTVTLSLLFSWDDQDYLPGADQLAVGTGEDYLQRRDHVRGQRISAAYVPRDWLEVDLSYRLEERQSNDAAFTYDDRLVVAAVKFTL